MTPRPLTPLQLNIITAVRLFQPATKKQIADYLGFPCLRRLGEHLVELRRTERIAATEQGRNARWVVSGRGPDWDAVPAAALRCGSIWEYADRMAR